MTEIHSWTGIEIKSESATAWWTK